MAKNWKHYWHSKSNPEHRRDSPEYYAQYGRELSLIAGDPSNKHVIEFGCGSGSLFVPMGFDRARAYRGVDFSDGMLAKFRSAFPDVDLVRADASSYRDEQKYDLIFSNAVAQYFDKTMFRRIISNAVQMLAPGGEILIGSVPWKNARRGYYLGELALRPRRKIAWDFMVYVDSLVRGDRLGRWYSLAEVVSITNQFNLSTEFFGSMHYPYRFHARLRGSVRGSPND